MTEEEAKTKRCPAPMGTMHDERTQNHCIGSDCMAWRWKIRPDQAKFQNDANAKHAGAYPGGPFKDDGYCGLAGKP